MQLLDWQSQLQQKILHPEDASFPELYAAINTNRVSQETRFGIYCDAYVLRLIEALKSNYPAMHQLLGDDDFDAVARIYIDTYPPEHASIRWFGNQLARFLIAQKPYADQPIFSELAQFEWALRHTIDAADADIVTVDSLQAIPAEQWADLCFTLHPSLTVLMLSWNTAQIWQALTNEENLPQPQSQAITWLVYRQPDLISAWRSSSEAEVASLQCVSEGKTFADICENLLRYSDHIQQVPAIAAGFLRGWAEQGMLVRK